MKSSTWGVLYLLILILASCNNEEPHHWSYEGETAPERWAEIEKDSDCDGLKQSPINIIDDSAIDDTLSQYELDFFYHRSTVITEVKNNGHSIELDFELGDSISFKNEMYHLLQIHFHEPSEHTINGIRYPIEIHFVHKSDLDHLTVISLLGTHGMDRELFGLLESFLPIQVNTSKEINEEAYLLSIYGELGDFYYYEGSLTTPPCTENVNWIIMKEPVAISEHQVQILQNNMPLNNYRHEQPLNDRNVYSVSIND